MRCLWGLYVFGHIFNCFSTYINKLSVCGFFVSLFTSIYICRLNLRENAMCTRCDEHCADFSFIPLPPGAVAEASFIPENPSVIYCNQCKDYCLAKSFAPGNTICGKHPILKKDANGKQWCRKCSEFVCISKFPVGQRRYICKRHAWNDTAKFAKAKSRSDPWRRELSKLYSLCYNDCRYFNQPRIELTQADIAKLFVGMIFNDGPGSSTDGNFGFAVLPTNPHDVLSNNNAAVVRRGDRIKLLTYLKKRDWDSYIVMVRRLAAAFIST